MVRRQNTTLWAHHRKLFFLVIVVKLLVLVVFLSVRGWFGREVVLGELATVNGDSRAPFTRDDLLVVTEEPVDREFSIFAPQIRVNAPVFANIDGSNERTYLANVLRGVAHYGHKNLGEVVVDGAFPGETGNIFLFGHSQIPGGDLSNYQGVFNNLEELVLGDVIQVFYKGEEYNYEVIEGRVVEKDAVEYLSHTESETLTLMSCWPLGLDWKRFLVRARRI